MPKYREIPDEPGTDLIDVSDPTGNGHDTQRVVIRDAHGQADDSGVYIGEHNSAGKRILLASRATAGWERDANGRVVVVEV